MTLSLCWVGKVVEMAGLSMPGRVLRTNLAIAISAPVLPPEITPAASPEPTASMANRMLELRPARNAADGLA